MFVILSTLQRVLSDSTDVGQKMQARQKSQFSNKQLQISDRGAWNFNFAPNFPQKGISASNLHF